MSRAGSVSLSVIALLFVMVAPAFADGAPDSGMSGDIYVTGTKVMVPNGPYTSTDMPVVGGGVRLAYRPEGGRFGYAANVEYGTGMTKLTQTSGGTADTYETDVNALSVNLAMLHYYDCCDFECGPDLYYENTSVTLKDPFGSEEKLKGINTFGIGGQFGGSFPLNDNLRVFGEDRQILAYTSWNQDIQGDNYKLKQYSLRSSWRGGLRVKF